jgi:small subunit ribosomal protein S16
MLRIRLRRVGKKKQPSYRIVVAESSAPRDGRFVEVIGFYNPRTEPETITLKEARILYWLGVGAQPSESVNRILNTTGTLDRFARQQAGESLETLVAEAEAAVTGEISPKTKPAVREAASEAEAGPEAEEAAEVPSAEESQAPSPEAEEDEVPSAEEDDVAVAEEGDVAVAEETEVPSGEEEAA